MMEIFNIDIEKLEQDSSHVISSSDITRRIITSLMRHKNEIIIETSRNYQCILVGSEIYERIMDNSAFHFSSLKINKFNHMGTLMGLDIFIESYGVLKPNQYIY